MKRLPPDNGSLTPCFDIRLKDFVVCWAGPHPFREGYCFGSEDGRLLFTDEEGNDLYGPIRGSVSGEAVNGVASWEHWLAVSTRYDVNLITLPRTLGETTQSAVFPAGAHGVAVTDSGYFVSPLGQSGILLVKPETAVDQPVTVIGGPPGTPYFYRTISLKKLGREVLVCATRGDGVAVVDFRGEESQHDTGTIGFDGLDVVDVCAISPASDSFAAAAVGKDGTIVLIQDVLHDKSPLTIKYESIKGVAYRLLSGRDDIFLLTSKGLYVLAGLAGRFLTRKSSDRFNTQIVEIPLQAVDASMYRNRRLLVVMLDSIRAFDIDAIRKIRPDFSREEKPKKGRNRSNRRTQNKTEAIEKRDIAFRPSGEIPSRILVPA